MIQIKVEGLRELGEALKALPAEVASRSGGPLRGALQAAGRVFQKEAKKNADTMPVSNVDDRDDYIRTGRLGRSIAVKRDRNPRDVTERVVVKPRGGNQHTKPDDKRAPYWDEVEFGTTKMPARPFMRPAADSQVHNALAEFKTKFGAGIKRAAAKAARLGLKPRG